jgi:hypothetical protein
MPTRIRFSRIDGDGTVDFEVAEDFDAVINGVAGALERGEKFVIVTRANGEDAGKRFTIPAANILTMREA